MRKIILLFATVSLFSCNDSKKEPAVTTPGGNNSTPVTSNPGLPSSPASTSGAMITVEGKDIEATGSLLVQKDKDHLKPGNDYMVMLTSRGKKDNEGFVLNFLMDLKPGTYPVVGSSFHRGEGDKNQMFGGILGGKPKLTDYTVNITECKDLGSNNMGGHKWSISGNFEGLVIKAMPIMLMDKTKNHPEEIKIDKGNFFNLTFDDNWEEMLKKGMEQLNKNK